MNKVQNISSFRAEPLRWSPLPVEAYHVRQMAKMVNGPFGSASGSAMEMPASTYMRNMDLEAWNLFYGVLSEEIPGEVLKPHPALPLKFERVVQAALEGKVKGKSLRAWMREKAPEDVLQLALCAPPPEGFQLEEWKKCVTKAQARVGHFQHRKT